MSNPGSQYVAARQARALLAKSLPGSRRGTVAGHLMRAERIGEVIWRRFQVGPYRWQLKHLRWYLTQATESYQPSTRYRHWLTVRVLVQALGREQDWVPRLQGAWVRPDGREGKLGFGRPAKRPVPRCDFRTTEVVEQEKKKRPSPRPSPTRKRAGEGEFR